MALWGFGIVFIVSMIKLLNKQVVGDLHGINETSP